MEVPQVWSYVCWDIRSFSNINRILVDDVFAQECRFKLILDTKSFLNAKYDCVELSLIDPEYSSNSPCSFMVSTYLRDIRGENHFVQQSRYVRAKPEAEKVIWRVTFIDLLENIRINWKESIKLVCMFGPESIYQKGVEEDIFRLRNLCTREDHLEKLSLEISSMFRQGCCNGDVTLKCGGKKIFAYKNILSAQSPVFRKLIQSEIDQQPLRDITINDTDYYSLRRLLVFLYSGAVLLSHETVDTGIRLYEAAQIYEVPGLQQECTRFLVNKLEEDTACKILLFAFEKKDEDFLNSVTSFIIKKEILKSKGWIEFWRKHPELAIRTYFSFLKYYILSRSNILHMKNIYLMPFEFVTL